MPGERESQVSGVWASQCNGPLVRNVTWVLQPATTGRAVFGLHNDTGCKLEGERLVPLTWLFRAETVIGAGIRLVKQQAS